MLKASIFYIACVCALLAKRNEGITTEGEKRIFKAGTTNMIVRSEPNTKSDKERNLVKGGLVQGVPVGQNEKIQGKTGRWIAIGGITVDHYVFGGFLSDVTADYEYKRDTCEIKGKVLACTTGKYPVDNAVQLQISKKVCGKKVGQVVVEYTSEDKGPAKLGKALKAISDEVDIYVRKKDGAAVQIDYFSTPIECN